MDKYKGSESDEPVDEGKKKNSAKISDHQLILRGKRQNAERVRACREKKKALGLQSSSQAELRYESPEKVSKLTTDAISSTSRGSASSPASKNIIADKIEHQKRLNAERCRRYTNLKNAEQINIPNFHCVSRQKHINSGYGRVAILKNTDNSLRVKSEMQEHMTNMSISQETTSRSAVGDFCAAICRLDDNRRLAIVSIYIKVSQKIDDIMDFLGYNLAPFATSSSQIFRSREIYSRMPIILSGDFNTDFKKEESAPLSEYLREVFNLEMKNDRTIPTTRYGTTIDAVFTRYIEKIECRPLFTYFSCHKMLITFIDCETQGDDEVAKITEVDTE